MPFWDEKVKRPQPRYDGEKDWERRQTGAGFSKIDKSIMNKL
jgi:hypothetical protein